MSKFTPPVRGLTRRRSGVVGEILNLPEKVNFVEVDGVKTTPLFSTSIIVYILHLVKGQRQRVKEVNKKERGIGRDLKGLI